MFALNVYSKIYAIFNKYVSRKRFGGTQIKNGAALVNSFDE